LVVAVTASTARGALDIAEFVPSFPERIIPLAEAIAAAAGACKAVIFLIVAFVFHGGAV
jgi:hypothetical protein